MFEPATGRWRASRTGRPEVILAGVAAGTVIAVVGIFLWAGVWDALAVVFVAPILVFIVAVVVALQSRRGALP